MIEWAVFSRSSQKAEPRNQSILRTTSLAFRKQMNVAKYPGRFNSKDRAGTGEPLSDHVFEIDLCSENSINSIGAPFSTIMAVLTPGLGASIPPRIVLPEMAA